MHDPSVASNDVEAIGRFIDGFHRYADPDQLRALPATLLLPPALAARGAALAQRFDAALAGSMAWPEQPPFDAILANLQVFARDSGWSRPAL